VLTYMLMEKMKALQAENRQLKDLIFDDVRSRVGAINAASPEALSGLADLQAVIAQHDEEQNGEEGNDDDEVDRLVAVTRERRRIWIEVLGQMAGPMSPLRMKSAESIWEGVKVPTVAHAWHCNSTGLTIRACKPNRRRAADLAERALGCPS
jgi:hypothetical protein